MGNANVIDNKPIEMIPLQTRKDRKKERDDEQRRRDKGKGKAGEDEHGHHDHEHGGSSHHHHHHHDEAPGSSHQHGRSLWVPRGALHHVSAGALKEPDVPRFGDVVELHAGTHYGIHPMFQVRIPELKHEDLLLLPAQDHSHGSGKETFVLYHFPGGAPDDRADAYKSGTAMGEMRIHFSKDDSTAYFAIPDGGVRRILKFKARTYKREIDHPRDDDRFKPGRMDVFLMEAEIDAQQNTKEYYPWVVSEDRYHMFADGGQYDGVRAQDMPYPAPDMWVEVASVQPDLAAETATRQYVFHFRRDGLSQAERVAALLALIWWTTATPGRGGYADRVGNFEDAVKPLKYP